MATITVQVAGDYMLEMTARQLKPHLGLRRTERKKYRGGQFPSGATALLLSLM